VSTGAQTAGKERILVLRPHAATIGGVEHYYNTLALDALDPRFEYFYVTSAVRESGARVMLRLAGLYWKFFRRLATREFRLVLINPSLNRNSYYRDSLFCIIARRMGCEVALFFRGWSSDMERLIQTSWLPKTVFRLGFGKIRNIIVLGDSFRMRLQALGCDPQASFTISTTVADDAYLPELDLPRRLQRTGELRVLFMSRLVPAKGAALALRAFGLASGIKPDVRFDLTIAGDGPELDALRRLVAEESIPNVHFAGAVTGAAKRRLLLDSDVFLFPTSHGEGLPNVVLEAMLYGMPVITRPVGGIPDVVRDSVNGFLRSDMDPAGFAECLVTLATDRMLLRRMSTANHQFAMGSCTTERVRQNLIATIDGYLAAADGFSRAS
jgi:glycosyltransferase involved in cell wall biosynthesis